MEWTRKANQMGSQQFLKKQAVNIVYCGIGSHIQCLHKHFNESESAPEQVICHK